MIIVGGAGNAAYHCTGGRQTDRDKCFNLRLMWRQVAVPKIQNLSYMSP